MVYSIHSIILTKFKIINLFYLYQGWFHVKDLSLIDSHDKLSVRTLIHLCKHKVAFCYTTDTLTNIFELFRHGSTHLAFVVDLIQDGDTDPYDTCVGIVTMHDIIEALLQFQLVDEATLTVASSSKYSSSSATFGINYLKKLIDSHNHKTSENLGALVPMISLQTKFILSQILNSKHHLLASINYHLMNILFFDFFLRHKTISRGIH